MSWEMTTDNVEEILEHMIECVDGRRPGDSEPRTGRLACRSTTLFAVHSRPHAQRFPRFPPRAVLTLGGCDALVMLTTISG